MIVPIKSKREVVCKQCKKKFIVECNDGITIEDLKRLNNKLCMKCRLIRMIRGKLK